MTLHKKIMLTVVSAMVLLPWVAMAAESAAPSITPTTSVFKMFFGLAAVLAVMAGVTWLVKRWLPNAGNSASVAKIVGGVSLGNRERLVVVQVADKWIVVGVAPGSVTSLANLDAGQALPESIVSSAGKATPVNEFASVLANWMKKK